MIINNIYWAPGILLSKSKFTLESFQAPEELTFILNHFENKETAESSHWSEVTKLVTALWDSESLAHDTKQLFATS